MLSGLTIDKLMMGLGIKVDMIIVANEITRNRWKICHSTTIVNVNRLFINQVVKNRSRINCDVFAKHYLKSTFLKTVKLDEQEMFPKVNIVTTYTCTCKCS